MAIRFSMAPTMVQVNSIGLFEPGGAVHIWATGVSKVMRKYAHDLAPPQHSEAKHGTWGRGHLQRSIYSEVYESPVTHQVGFEVGAKVPYAIYVHDGTMNQGRHGYIYTTRGWAQKGLVDEWVKLGQFQGSADDRGFWMPITRIPGKTQFALRVRGQRSNPFISDAYRLTRNKHPGLPHMTLQRKIRKKGS